MRAYPVAIGETGDYRAAIEGLLSNDNDALAERIAFLDEAVQKGGVRATFGVELECHVLPDPSASRVVPFENPAEIYEAIVGRFQNVAASPAYQKGELVLPEDHPEPIMVAPRLGNTYNADNPQSDIVEIRTAPASALETQSRYWRLIQAVGGAAADRGHMALLLATQVSGAVITEEREEGPFVRFNRPETASRGLLAVTQHNLDKLHALQVEAGLEQGLTVSEAFPICKASSTVVHDQRLEFQHGSVGIADPRIDMLAFLDGTQAMLKGVVPLAAQSSWREVEHLLPQRGDSPLARALGMGMLVLDKRSKRLVMPATLNRIGWREGEYALDMLTMDITKGAEGAAFANDGRALRQFSSYLRFDNDRMQLTEGPYGHMASQVADIREFVIEPHQRIIPRHWYESSGMHRERRTNLRHSPVARRIFGEAIGTLVSADEAINARAALIAQTMVIERH
jgi:hypothetical protein